MNQSCILRVKPNEVCLPDEVIEHILSFIPPLELCTYGWETVSVGFKNLITELLAKVKHLKTLSDETNGLFSKLSLVDSTNNPFSRDQLYCVLQKLFPHLTSLTVDAPILLATLRMRMESSKCEVLMPDLRSIDIVVDKSCGSISADEWDIMLDLPLARLLAVELKSVKISILLSEETAVSFGCCNFKVILRFASEMIGAAGKWSLCLKDATKRAQGWFCPSELSNCRNIAFVCYIRAALDMGILLNRLELIDEYKMSPYMMVMQKKRRFLYVYEEFKHCERLSLQYDIGIIAPSFARVGLTFPNLQSVEVVSSHVLYKNDLLRFLADCPNLKTVWVVLPPHWTERTARCSYGCFRNADFACFMESGWASLPFILPKTSLRLTCSCKDIVQD
ncbi:hypothetical protein AB6A40_008281 [Gnathostoma spinigerum]|uniref:F-box domain-containing protein n=1 Tax=Gnathostoma spinigerum TaxID=75299 RepID=A0ABD6EY00_9BILA